MKMVDRLSWESPTKNVIILLVTGEPPFFLLVIDRDHYSKLHIFGGDQTFDALRIEHFEGFR